MHSIATSVATRYAYTCALRADAHTCFLSQHMFELHADAYALLFVSSLFFPTSAGYAGLVRTRVRRFVWCML